MNVHLASVERVLIDAELGRVALHVRERDPRRLLHHGSELTRQDQTAFAWHSRRLDEQHVASRAGDREARGHAGDRGADGRLVKNLGTPERIAHGRFIDRDRRRLVR